VNNELESMRKVEDVAEFNVLAQYLPQETEKNHDGRQSDIS
jgi:hypothetical protein